MERLFDNKRFSDITIYHSFIYILEEFKILLEKHKDLFDKIVKLTSLEHFYYSYLLMNGLKVPRRDFLYVRAMKNIKGIYYLPNEKLSELIKLPVEQLINPLVNYSNLTIINDERYCHKDIREKVLTNAETGFWIVRLNVFNRGGMDEVKRNFSEEIRKGHVIIEEVEGEWQYYFASTGCVNL
ncbi:hypothetical protein ABK040_016898 [Willaertia magna]